MYCLHSIRVQCVCVCVCSVCVCVCVVQLLLELSSLGVFFLLFVTFLLIPLPFASL